MPAAENVEAVIVAQLTLAAKAIESEKCDQY